MSPERPQEGVREVSTPAPENLERKLDELRRSYGIPQALPESMSQEDMNKELDQMRSDATFADMAELIRFNQLLYRKSSLQFSAARQQGSEVIDSQFVTVNQAETFFEYYQSILSQTLAACDDYLVLRRSVSVVPPDVLADERQTEIFVQELKHALDRRLAFSNASLVSHLLATQTNRTGQVMQDQSTLLKTLEQYKASLDAAGQLALGSNNAEATRVHTNALDQRIIELIAEKGHLPSRMLLGLQAQRYSDILAQQRSVIRDGGLARERAEWDRLTAKNRLAREGKGPELTEEEGFRFNQLKELLEKAIPGYQQLSEERRGFSDQMVRTADSLSAFHERSLEMLVMQHQFRGSDSVERASPPNPDQTPPIVREKIDEVTRMRADFHRERIGAFVSRFEEEVLTIGLPERVEEFSNSTGREFVRHISNKLSYLFTLPAPDALGIRDYLRGRLAGPLNDAMGWPSDKMDMRFEQLDPEEQKAVMEKMRSVADAVRSFDRTKMDAVRGSLEVVRLLPPAKNALSEAPKDPLPELSARITPQNLQNLIDEHGLATVYALALRQLSDDMGDPETGFLGEVNTFTNRVNGVIDVHLDVSDALHRQGDEWRRWMFALLLAALGGAAAATLAPRIFRSAVRRLTTSTRPAAPAQRTRAPSSPAPESPAAPAARAAETATGVDDVIRNQQKLADLVARTSRSLNTTEVMDFLRAAEQAGAVRLDQPTLALLRDSPKGQGIIAGAVRTGNPDEVTRAVRAASGAAKLRVALNTVGAAADMFVIYMAYADWKANGERIQATDNPALKELYANANYVYAAEGGSGVVGLSVAGYAMVSSYMAGEGLLAAAAAPGALIVLPIAVAAAAGGYYYRKLEGVTEDWTKEEKDWLRHSQGDLLKRLEERAPGQHGYWQGAAAATNAEVGWNWLTMNSEDYGQWRQQGFDRVEGANAGQRFSMTRAYMGRTALIQPLPGESESVYRQRYATHLQDSMGFIAKMSQGAFSREFSYVYENAELHAEIRDLSRRLSAEGASQFITITKSDEHGAMKEIRFNLADYNTLIGKYSGQSGLSDSSVGGMEVSPLEVIEAYRRAEITGVLSQLSVMSNSLFRGQPEKKVAMNALLQYELLDRIRHQVAAADMRIEMADLVGWEVTGGEAEAKNLTRYFVAVGIRRIIRDEADNLMDRMTSGEEVTREDVDAVIDRMKSFLGTDPLTLQKDAEKGLVNSLNEARASTPDVLTYQSLRESLYLWPNAEEQLRRLSIGRVGQ